MGTNTLVGIILPHSLRRNRLSSQNTNTQNSPAHYKDAGVDIEAGNQLVERIKPLAKKTYRSGVLGGIGGFAALFELPMDRYRNPLIVSATDGVGTKLKLAMMLNQHDTIGIDLVAMCANDIIVCGAEPLFFLDYYAMGKLSVDRAEVILRGISEGCQRANIALVGGETAEMPGMYQGDDYDLAGFCVGAVEKTKLITGEKVQAGDVLIGLTSSGPHSNGYSLIRKIIADQRLNLSAQYLDGKTLSECLIAPTKIYVKSILPLLEQDNIHAMAHITGGGFTDNLPRVIPKNLCAAIELNRWQRPEIFTLLQKYGAIPEIEMLHTFNCGIGFVLCVAERNAEAVLAQLAETGETAIIIGHIEHNDAQNEPIRYIR